MPVRFAQASDGNAVVNLHNVGGVLEELRADWGPVRALTLAELATFLTDPKKRAIVHHQGSTINGVLLSQNTQLPLASGWWQITRTWTRKTFTVQQRLDGFGDMAKFVAGQFPNVTIWGNVKTNGNLHNFLKTKPFNFDDGSAVFPNPVPGEPDDVLLALPVTKVWALAAVVAANF